MKSLYRQRSGAYSTSKDYAHLKELLDKGLFVVAFINYDAGSERYLFQDVCLEREYVEVIGNVHDNKELLKKEE